MSNSNILDIVTRAQTASQLVRVVPEPEDRRWPTGNYIVDYEHQSLGVGGLVQLFMVGSERTFQPSVISLSFNKHASQRVLADVSVCTEWRQNIYSDRGNLMFISVSIRLYFLLGLLKAARCERSSTSGINEDGYFQYESATTD